MSRTIEIDEEVYNSLVQRVTGFNQRPNDILRNLLGLNSSPAKDAPSVATEPPTTLSHFIATDGYKLRRTAIEKYLLILSWLEKNHRSDFQKLEKLSRGKRVYFASDPRLIAESGQSLSVKQIPDTAYYALATLDNRSKRIIIADVLALFGYSNEIRTKIAETIEDSGIRRSQLLTLVHFDRD